ncbi:OadG family transporter subunit [Phycisphaerales bacterium AB-hyl4]|uniref:OadG family transporter subunit n=1 Tax=Natronomicrosphaera hydrolytica TaxID=3242702 RepID=A0ABV4U5C9_9BACT
MSTGEALELGLTFAVVGMVVVFAVLGTIALLISLLNRWSDQLDEKNAPAVTAAAPAGGIDSQTLAVIAAAATAAIKRPVRVREVKVHE